MLNLPPILDRSEKDLHAHKKLNMSRKDVAWRDRFVCSLHVICFSFQRVLFSWGLNQATGSCCLRQTACRWPMIYPLFPQNCLLHMPEAVFPASLMPLAHPAEEASNNFKRMESGSHLKSVFV